MRLLFISEQICSVGGAEFALSQIMNNLVRSGCEVSLLTFDTEDKSLIYELDKKIDWYRVQISSKVIQTYKLLPGRLLKRVFYCATLLKKIKPQLLIGFTDFSNIFTLMLGLKSRIPSIVCERSNPIKRPTLKKWKLLRYILFPFAKKIIIQTQAVRKKYPFYLRSKMTVIPNFIKAPVATNNTKKMQRPYILNIGRLRYVKGQDFLIRSFSLLAGKFPQWSLVIVGEGSYRSVLENLISKLGLKDRVYLLGEISDPASILNETDIFAFTSRWEGFPNALAQAMAAGKAVVSLDCDHGPRDLIPTNEWGSLVSENCIHAYSRELQNLMESPERRLNLGNQAMKVTEKFNEEKVVEMWLKTFKYSLGVPTQ